MLEETAKESITSESIPMDDPWADVDHTKDLENDELPVIEEVEDNSVVEEDVHESIEDSVVEEAEVDEDTEPDFSSMTVAQLKVELKERGLSLKGRKVELLARLQDQ